MKPKTTVEKYFDKIAVDYDFYKKKNKYYYDNLKRLLKSLIPQNRNIFEIGCGTGDVLVSLKPKNGYGMDISSGMIRIAEAKHLGKPEIHFSTKLPKGKFDYIFMSDVVEHLEKPEAAFNEISRLMDKNTIFINTMANPIWEPVLMLAEKLGLKMPEGKHHRIKYNKLKSIIESMGLKIVKHDYKLLVPIRIPFITKFLNRYLGGLLRKYAFIEYIVATKSQFSCNCSVPSYFAFNHYPCN